MNSLVNAKIIAAQMEITFAAFRASMEKTRKAIENAEFMFANKMTYRYA